jgi:KUP system potassium uptake protein
MESRASPAPRVPVARRSAAAGSTVGALGVVFGDIGTSPLYAIQIAFAAGGAALRPTPEAVYGVMSLVFWSITVIVSVKYLAFVLRADNDGEGGTSRSRRSCGAPPPRSRQAVQHGVAVSGTFVITSVLFVAVARWRWRWRPRTIAVCVASFLGLEGVFLAANLTKIDQGAWLPLVIGVGLYALMMTWSRGRAMLAGNRTREEGPLRPFVEELNALEPPLPRVRGTGVFLNASADTTPIALRANVEHNHVLHEQVVIVTARSANVPRVHPEDRIAIDDLGYTDDDITHVTARFGFQEEPDIPEALRLATEQGLECDIDLEAPTYFLSRVTIRVTDAPGMDRWRKRLFVAIWRNAANPVEYFQLPDRRTVTLGWQIPL